MINITIIKNEENLNFTSTESLNIKIFKKTSTGYNEILIEDTFINNYEFSLSADGLYVLEFSNNDPNCKTLTTTYYKNTELKESFLDTVENLLCNENNCQCTECEDCFEETEIISILKNLSFYYLQNPQLTLYQQAAFSCISNILSEINISILLDEKILGDSKNKELLKLILAFHYYVLYKYEIDTNVNLEWVENTYRKTTILTCIENTKLPIECIDSKLNIFLPNIQVNNLEEILSLSQNNYLKIINDEGLKIIQKTDELPVYNSFKEAEEDESFITEYYLLSKNNLEGIFSNGTSFPVFKK